MEHYSIFEDFAHYVEENYDLISFLEMNDSILNDYVAPIIKTLTYLKKLKEVQEEELNEEDEAIFAFGFEYLFENIEQIKLYLKQLEDDYFNLEQNSFYINMVFQLEELKVELQKMEENEAGREQDLHLINQLLEYMESLIAIDSVVMDDQKLQESIENYERLYQKYEEVVRLTDAFHEYCATYGI
jgi:hypothetical protein